MSSQDKEQKEQRITELESGSKVRLPQYSININFKYYDIDLIRLSMHGVSACVCCAQSVLIVTSMVLPYIHVHTTFELDPSTSHHFTP